MKKLVSLVTLLVMLMTMAGAMAEGVVVIKSPQQQVEEEPVDMKNIKLGKDIDIEGYGVIRPVSCEFVDKIVVDYYNEFSSGDEAQYLLLIVEILNTQYVNASYYDNVAVSASFGDGYEFGGWKRQYKKSTSTEVFKNANESFEISPLYKGKYAFVVTVPNYVVDTPAPLSITVKLTDEIEMTYIMRK